MGLYCWLLWLLVTCRILGGVLLRCLVWVGLVVRLLSSCLPVRIRMLWIVVRHGRVIARRDLCSDGMVKTIWKYKGSLHCGSLETFYQSSRMRQKTPFDMSTRADRHYRPISNPKHLRPMLACSSNFLAVSHNRQTASETCCACLCERIDSSRRAMTGVPCGRPQENGAVRHS